MTPKENYLIAARGGKPERLPVFPADANVFAPEFWAWRDPDTGADFCNVKWVKDDFGEMPDLKWHAMDNVFQWRETIKFPKLSELDWEGMKERFLTSADYDSNKVTIARLNTHGIFLIPVNMLGWEKALCAVLEEPEEMDELISTITNFLLETLDYIEEYIHPDIVFSGDDFAGNGGPFFSKVVFQEAYSPYLRKISERIHQMGALAEFHCCGNCGYLIREMKDLGYDICQLPEPNEALLKDKIELGDKLVITGGWDRRGPGNKEFADENTVRMSVHTAVDTYGKEGGLIFWDGGILGQTDDAKNKRAWVYDEVSKYGSIVYR